MKSWKKIIVATSLGLALALGGYSSVHTIKNVTERRELKKNYSKILEDYKSLSLDSLISKDFDYNKVNTEWQDEENFLADKENGLHVWYNKDYKSNTKLIHKKDRQRPMNRMDFEIWLGMDGKPYGVTGETYKWVEDVWGGRQLWIDKMITFLKKEHKGEYSYYVDNDGYIRNESKPVVIKDKELIKQVEELFEAASKDYQKVDSLVRKQ